MDELRVKAPWWFWVVSVVALLWNLMGVGAYVMQVTASPEDILEQYGQEQANLIAAQPAWYTAVFALAVFGGALGCLLLLLRKKVALWPLLLSLFCVIAQNVYFAMNGVYDHIHGGAWAMTILIPVIALFLVWFARTLTRKGVLA